MILSVLFILVVLAAAVLVIIAAVLIFALTRRSGDEALYCGKCGYAATGLPEARCPECGCDFASVGLVNRPRGAHWRGLVLVAAWIVLSPFVLVFLAGQVLTVGPHNTEAYNFELWHTPQSGAYERVYLEQKTTSRIVAGQSRQIPIRSKWQVSVEQEGVLLDIHGDLIAGTALVKDGQSVQTVQEDLSPQLLTNLFVSAFPDADPELLKLEAKDIHDRLIYHINSEAIEPIPVSFDHIGNNGWSAWRAPARGYAIAVIAFFVLLWVAGIILIARLAHRRQGTQ
jgi:hypothetical protein